MIFRASAIPPRELCDENDFVLHEWTLKWRFCREITTRDESAAEEIGSYRVCAFEARTHDRAKKAGKP